MSYYISRSSPSYERTKVDGGKGGEVKEKGDFVAKSWQDKRAAARQILNDSYQLIQSE